jgi:uncharacterized OsmC-like protein
MLVLVQYHDDCLHLHQGLEHMDNSISISVTQQNNYQFLVDFSGAMAPMFADEPAPLGTGTGPSPSQLLLAAVANCLTASLLYSVQKFKQDAGGISATATARIDRNEKKLLRVQEIVVSIRFGKEGKEIAHLDRILSQFEDFCTVSQSVRAGIPVTVSVEDGLGVRLK